jgi:hypothetical protein
LIGCWINALTILCMASTELKTILQKCAME